MSAISLKSITGITSITTPAGVDNQLTLHNNNTTEAVKLDVAGNLHFHNHLNITGVSTVTSFLQVLGQAGTSDKGFEVRANSTQSTDTNKAIRIRNNSNTDTFNISYKGKVTATELDISGNLDVDGHTNLDNVSVAGVSTFAGGINFNVSPAITIRDGTTEKGYIGFNANDPFIGRKNGVGLLFQDNKVRPVDGDTGIGTNNTVSLGEPTYKFKDLYLEGDIHIDSDVGQLRIGADEDLKIDHNGSNAYFMNGTGQTINRADGYTFENGNGSTEYARITAAGNVIVNNTTAAAGSYTYKLLTSDNISSSEQTFGVQYPGVVTYGLNAESNADFTIKKDGAERLRIAADGRIGINDSSPNDYEVDIKKRSTATDANIRLYNDATGSSNDTIMRYQIAGTTAKNIIYFGDGDDSNVGMIRYHHSDDSLEFTAGAAERLRITSTGQVKITGSDDQDNFIVDASQTQFAIHQDASDGEISLRAQDGSGNNYAKYMTFFVEGGSGSVERVRISSSGNVSVGTQTNAGNTLRYLDVANYFAGPDAGSILRLLSRNSNDTANVGLDIVKYKAGAARLINYETLGDNGFIAFSTGVNGGSPNEKVRITSRGTTVSGGTIPSDTTTYSSSFRGREGVIGPIYYWPRVYGVHDKGGGYTDVSEGNRLTLRMYGSLGGTASMFQNGFSANAYGAGGEALAYNRVRVLFRVSRANTTDGYNANQIQFKMQSYYYSGGWTDITNSAWNFSGTDGERGYRWTASNWISLSDFAGGADVPSIAIKYESDLGNLSNANIRIAAVYLQYAYFN